MCVFGTFVCNPTMKVFLFLILIIGFNQIPSGLGGDVTSRPAVVNIGALLTYSSTIGRAAMAGINAAVEEINSNRSILPGTRLVIQMQDYDCSGSAGVIEALQFMETGDIAAVIGPQSSVVAHVLSYIGSVLQVPLLSFGATDPSLSSYQYPFFVRATHSDLFQMTAVADILDYYQWKHVTTIFVDDDYGRSGIVSLGVLLSERSSKITNKAALAPGASTTDIVDLLDQVAFMESRVIVLHVHTDIGIRVLTEANSLGMLQSGFVWIATDWLSSLLDSSASLGPSVMDIMQGVVTMRQHTVDANRKNDIISNLRKLTMNRTGGGFQLNSYGLYAYDTVWMLAHALDAFFNDDGIISFSNSSMLHGRGIGALFDGGKLLLSKILETDFEGVTGPFRFNSDRHLTRPAYDILNVVGNGVRVIGYWSNYSGLSTVSPESIYLEPANFFNLTQQLHGVIWPGEMATKPRGWAFSSNGRELRIGIPYKVIFKEFVGQDNKTGIVKGYCIDVFTAALDLLPYAVPYRFVPFGNGNDNPSYNDFIGMVGSNIYDAAVGDITIIANRTKIVDFTQPYIESGIAVMAAVQDHNSSPWTFFQPFTLEMWCVTALSILVVGVVVWILEHRINDEFRGPPKKQLATVFWFTFSTLFFAHKETTVSTLGRAVLILWLCVVLIIQSSYTASLTSILTVQQLSSSLTGIGSLINSNDPIGFQAGSYVENYMLEDLGISKSRLVPLQTRDEYVKALDLGPNNGGVAAIVDERPYIDLFLSTRCGFAIVGSDFTRSGWGFAFPKDSPLAVDMSSAILKLSENGDLERIHDQWLSGGDCVKQKSGSNYGRLHLSSFSGLFLLCGLACILALFIYLCLVLLQFLRHYPLMEHIPSDTRSSWRHKVQKFLSFVDDDEEYAKNKFNRTQDVPVDTNSGSISERLHIPNFNSSDIIIERLQINNARASGSNIER